MSVVPLRPGAAWSSGLRRAAAPLTTSAALIEATTSLGPVNFGAMGLEGYIEIVLRDGEVDFTTGLDVHLEVHFDRLTSGNTAYDAELRRHVSARRFPAAYVDLLHVSRSETTPTTYLVDGKLTLCVPPFGSRVRLESTSPTGPPWWWSA